VRKETGKKFDHGKKGKAKKSRNNAGLNVGVP